MSSEVGSIRLRELSFRITKGTTPTKGEGFVACGVNYIKSESITADGSIDASKFAFIDSETHDKLARSQLHAGNVLFSMAGVYLGKTAVVLPEHLPANTNQAVGIVTLDESKADPYFIHYSLQSPACRAWVLRSAAQSAQPNFNLQEIGDLRIPAFPIARQKEIASVLRMLDDRIAILRETNATLEAIAQAMFKSWFVDFDPVHAKQQGRAPEGMSEATAALFPDSFEESELGLVPRGWKVKTLGEICSMTIGGLWGKDTQEDVDLVPAISLRGVDLENLRAYGFAKEAPVRWVKTSALEKRRITESEVLIASSGAGPCGRPLWAGADFESIYGMPVIFSNFVKRLECGSATKAIYVDRLLADMRISQEIWNYINGTSIPNLDDKLLLATKKVVIPTDEILSAFEEIVRPIYQKLYSQKAQTLATLRDTLLPRLISGQLRLPEAEAALVEVAA